MLDLGNKIDQVDSALCANLATSNFNIDMIAGTPVIHFLDDTLSCFLLAFPQNKNENDRDEEMCNHTIPGAFPDDFMLRLDINGFAETRALPHAFTQYLGTVQKNEIIATFYAVTVPFSFLQSFADHTFYVPPPCALKMNGPFECALLPLSLTLITLANSYDWALEPETSCGYTSAMTLEPIHQVSIALYPLSRKEQTSKSLIRCTTAHGLGRWANEAKDGVGPSLEGLFWHTDGCLLEMFSGPDIHACFQNRFPASSTVVFLGDSNIRREFKTLRGLSFSEGAESLWCSQRRNDSTCLCSDSEERGEYHADNGAKFSIGEIDVLMLFMPGVLVVNEYDMPSWRAQIKDLERMVTEGSTLSAIVFDLVHWEVAYAPYSQFLSEVKSFAAALLSLANYAESERGHKLLLVYRRPNFSMYLVPPGVLFPFGRYDTHGRNELFSRFADEIFMEVLGDELVIWDAFNAQQNKPWDYGLAHIKQCIDAGRAFHPPSEDHEVFIQLLLHELCSR